MKFKKLISLCAVMMLTGCTATQSITVEEAKASVSAIEEKVESEDFTLPKQFSVKAVGTVDTFDTETLVPSSQKVDLLINVDFEQEQLYLHAKTEYTKSKDNSQVVEVEEYRYKEGDNYVAAISLKQNSEDAINLVCYYDGINSFVPDNSSFPSLLSSFTSIINLNNMLSSMVEQANHVLASPNEIEENFESEIELPEGGKSSFKMTFTGDTNGNFGMNLEGKASFGQSQDGMSVKMNYEVVSKISIKNYLPHEIDEVDYYSATMTVNKETQKLTQGFKQNVKFSYSSFTFTKPDLTTYQEVAPSTSAE